MKKTILLLGVLGCTTSFCHAQYVETWRVDESTIMVRADTILHFDASGHPLSMEAFNDSLQTGKYIITSKERGRTMTDYLTPKHPTAETLVGQQLPRTTFTDIDGNRVDVDSAGLTVVSAWNKTCGICIAELTALDIMADDFPGVQFVALAGDPEADTRQFLEQARWKWQDIIVVPDPERSLMQSFHIFTEPTNFIVDRRGTVRAALFGGDVRRLVTTLDRLCREILPAPDE